MMDYHAPLDYPKEIPIMCVSGGVSNEAKSIEQYLHEILRPSPGDSVLSGWRNRLKNIVRDIQKECSFQDWDGYDAKPISSQTAQLMFRFIDNLPDNIFISEIVPEPDGNLAIEWNNGENVHFSVSLTSMEEHGIIIYAGYFGKHDKQYGENIYLDEIPASVKRILNENFLKI